MARVTVEDCLENVDNRFELVMLASKRARQLAVGEKEATLEWDKDKPTVMALREIAKPSIDIQALRDAPEPIVPKKQVPPAPQPLFSLDDD